MARKRQPAWSGRAQPAQQLFRQCLAPKEQRGVANIEIMQAFEGRLGVGIVGCGEGVRRIGCARADDDSATRRWMNDDFTACEVVTPARVHLVTDMLLDLIRAANNQPV